MITMHQLLITLQAEMKRKVCSNYSRIYQKEQFFSTSGGQTIAYEMTIDMRFFEEGV